VRVARLRHLTRACAVSDPPPPLEPGSEAAGFTRLMAADPPVGSVPEPPAEPPPGPNPLTLLNPVDPHDPPFPDEAGGSTAPERPWPRKKTRRNIADVPRSARVLALKITLVAPAGPGSSS